MINKLANYSPEDVVILLAGIHKVTGFADGTFVSIDKFSPTFTVKESTDGFVTRSLRASNLYTVRLTLNQASDSNNVLSLFHNADKITRGRAKFPIIIKDGSGSSVMFSAEAWISSVPSAQFSTSIEVREWEITCAAAANNIGGNYSESTIVEDILSVGGGLLGGVL